MSGLKRFFAPKGRGKIRWINFFILVLFAGTLFYNLLEFYNGNIETLNADIQKVSFLHSVNLRAIHFGGWPSDAFHLGLDLKGGTHLEYQADLSKTPENEKDSAIAGVRDVIERRINIFGVAEPLVQTVKVGNTYHVIVELAGVKDVGQAIKMIGDTPLLEFKEQYAQGEQPPTPSLTSDQKKQLDAFNKSARSKAEDILKKATVPNADFTTLAKQYSDDSTTKTAGGDMGWVRQNGQNGFLLSATNGLQPGQVKNDLLQYSDGLSVVKLLGTRQGQEIEASHILICFKGATNCSSNLSLGDARKKIEDLQKQVTPQNFADMAKKYSTEPGAATRGGDLGWFGRGTMVKQFEDAAFALKKNSISGVVQTEFGFHLILKRDERPVTEYHVARILVKTETQSDLLPAPSQWKDTPLSGKQLSRATVDFNDPNGLPEVALQFNDEGKKLFADMTKRDVGKPIAIFLDGAPISTPMVQQPIIDGNAVITGNFTLDDAKLLAQRLNTGALPVPISLISEQTIGPSLGAESLHKSLTAGIFGFLLVALFMIFFYRLSGILAVVALIIYTSIALSIFKIVPVTLSLAGIAGFILSVGMAVDANILIFERMKEELRAKKPLDVSITEGFKRAWTSIRDSNVSSLITCLILFWFSASLIKGFALTLAIGILVSMFSAVFITRIFLKTVGAWKMAKQHWLFGAKKE